LTWHAFKKHDGKFYEAKGQRYKLFWMGSEEKLDGVGIFVAEKCVDGVVSVERHSKRVLILKMILDNGLFNALMVYPSQGNQRRKKRVFGMKCSIW